MYNIHKQGVPVEDFLGAVKKAKIFLIALLFSQIVVVRGIFNFFSLRH
jgi:hypothetical protein